jgi:hypothetical protein
MKGYTTNTIQKIRKGTPKAITDKPRQQQNNSKTITTEWQHNAA